MGTPPVWTLAPKVDPAPAGLLDLVDGQSVIADILARRGFADPGRARAFLDPAFYTPGAPIELPDLETAVRLLRRAIDHGQTILIWGDFDVDGQTASALLLTALRPLTSTRIHIPNRIHDGHGIQIARLRERIDHDQPALLLTCDTGVTAHEAIVYARQSGLITIVTDHHELGETLPNADAVVNPNRLPPGHPLRGLPGVGVAYQVIAQLYAELGRWQEAEVLLDLVALGIVADVAPQVDDTRYLLQRGLERLRHTERPGLRALFQVAHIEPLSVSEEQIGFQLGPRLNAAGRIADAMLSVDLLTVRDPGRAAILAQQLDSANAQRRHLQREAEQLAFDMIEQDPSLIDDYAGLVLYQPGWHAGILGPVAGRLADAFGRPVIMLSSADEKQRTARGSARATAGYHLSSALDAVSELLIEHGGHAGAAGLLLAIGDIPAFRRALSQVLVSQMNETAPNADANASEPSLAIEAQLPLHLADTAFTEALARLAPFGSGNPTPIFEADDLIANGTRFLDHAHEHQMLDVRDSEGRRFSLYWWNSGGLDIPLGIIDVAYTVSMNPREPQRQLTLIDFRVQVPLPEPERIIHQIDDLRQYAAAPYGELARLRQKYPDLLVWAEGYSRAESPGRGRHALEGVGQPLLIFSTPPSGACLREVIDSIQPPILIVFGVPPPAQTPREFMLLLAGIARTAAERGIAVSLDELSARTAQTERTIRLGLRLLPPQFAVEWDDAAVLFKHSSPDLTPSEADELPDAWPLLRRSLEESRAYREFFRQAPLNALFADVP